MPDNQPQRPRCSGRAGRPGGPPGEAAGDDPVSLLLNGARLADGRTVDVRLAGPRIEAVGAPGSLPAVPGTARVDLDGYLLLPAPAEPHAHGDTALSAEPDLSADATGSVGYEPDVVQRRATEAALVQLGHGATAVRSHVRIGDEWGLATLSAVLRAARALRGLVEVSVVAVPRVLTGVAGATGRALLRDAVRMGASVVGGCPDADPDPAGFVVAAVRVATDYGCPVDLHADGADPAWLTRLAAAVRGLRPGVTIGPCGGLGRLPGTVAGRAAERLAAAGVTVVCLPQGGCGYPGVGPDGRTARMADAAGPVLVDPAGQAELPGVAPVRMLRAAGVRVAAGSGALRDRAHPVARGDPLEAAYLLAAREGLRPADAYDTVCSAARAALGLPEVRVAAGFPAELLAVRGRRLADVLSLGYSRVVVHRGRVVVRTSAVREYGDSAVAAALGLPRQGARPGAPGSG